MILVVLVVAAIVVAVYAGARKAPWFLRVIPLVLYPFYRFSGSLVFLVSAGAALYLPYVDSTAPQEMLLFAIPGLLFLALAFAKLTILILKSPSTRWWMVILKLNFGLAAVICFPIGLIAGACWWWFEVRQVQGQHVRKSTADPWANWQFARSGSRQRDLVSRTTALAPRTPKK